MWGVDCKHAESLPATEPRRTDACERRRTGVSNDKLAVMSPSPPPWLLLMLMVPPPLMVLLCCSVTAVSSQLAWTPIYVGSNSECQFLKNHLLFNSHPHCIYIYIYTYNYVVGIYLGIYIYIRGPQYSYRRVCRKHFLVIYIYIYNQC